MIVEPMAADTVEGNMNPVGRLYYAGSTMLCTPNALSQDPRVALGAQAGEEALDRGDSRGRFHLGASRCGDAVQYRARGPTLGGSRFRGCRDRESRLGIPDLRANLARDRR